MSEEEFLKMLKAHDWYYQYSDDHRVWSKGRAESQAIFAAMKANPELGKIYQEYKK